MVSLADVRKVFNSCDKTHIQMIQQKREQQELVKIKSKCFEAWKLYSQRYKKSIHNNILANHFYLQQLFRKTIRSFLKYPNQIRLRMLFLKLKQATLAQTRATQQMQTILMTHRKRRVLKSVMEMHRQRKKCKVILEVSHRHRELKLMDKYFEFLKNGTIIDKFVRRIQRKKKAEAFETFVTHSSAYATGRRIMKISMEKASIHYQRKLKEKYFTMIGTASIINRYQSVRSLLLKKNLITFAKIIKKNQKLQSRKAKKFLREHLLRRYFNRLSNGVIQLKTTKLFKSKRLSKCFLAWFNITRQSKKEQANISIETVRQIQQIHNYSLKKQWFNKIYSIYIKRQQMRNRKKIVQDYYELKTTQILYRKYFDRMKRFCQQSKANKLRNNHLLRKSWQGFQLNYISQGQKKIAFEEFLIKKDLNKMRKAFGVFQEGLRKKQTAISHYKKTLTKRYLNKWILSVVGEYVSKVQKAENYYYTNTKFKVMFALKRQVEISYNMLDVLRIRVKSRISGWIRLFILKKALEARDIQIKAKVFRELKLLRYKKFS